MAFDVFIKFTHVSRVNLQQQDPAMDNLRILWRDTALDMLDSRDRFTRAAVLREFREILQAEFNEKASKRLVVFDPVTSGYVTTLCEGRFAVAFYRQSQETAEICAVFPTHYDLNQFPTAKLKNYVQHAAKVESRGRVIIP